MIDRDRDRHGGVALLHELGGGSTVDHERLDVEARVAQLGQVTAHASSRGSAPPWLAMHGITWRRVTSQAWCAARCDAPRITWDFIAGGAWASAGATRAMSTRRSVRRWFSTVAARPRAKIAAEAAGTACGREPSAYNRSEEPHAAVLVLGPRTENWASSARFLDHRTGVADSAQRPTMSGAAEDVEVGAVRSRCRRRTSLASRRNPDGRRGRGIRRCGHLGRVHGGLRGRGRARGAFGGRSDGRHDVRAGGWAACCGRALSGQHRGEAARFAAQRVDEGGRA